MRQILNLIVLLSALTLFGFKSGKNITPPHVGKVVKHFSLMNIDGRKIALDDFNDAKGLIVVFTCNHCPFAKLYPQRFNDLNSKYKSLGIPLIAINPMDSLLYEEETFEQMKLKAANEQFNFPYLQDMNQVVASDFGATHTPHAFIVWHENNQWVIRYCGAIDDNGEEPSKATSFIAKACDELLNGKKVSKPETQSIGCRINYRNK
jgi:peroxiredoxin